MYASAQDEIIVKDCTFSGNSALLGGAIHASSFEGTDVASMEIARCSFV